MQSQSQQINYSQVYMDPNTNCLNNIRWTLTWGETLHINLFCRFHACHIDWLFYKQLPTTFTTSIVLSTFRPTCVENLNWIKLSICQSDYLREDSISILQWIRVFFFSHFLFLSLVGWHRITIWQHKMKCFSRLKVRSQWAIATSQIQYFLQRYQKLVNQSLTRMHSSRMRTARTLTVGGRGGWVSVKKNTRNR